MKTVPPWKSGGAGWHLPITFRTSAEQYFESVTEGNPSEAAVQMVTHFKSSLEWAKRVIENDRTGNPSQAAVEIARCSPTIEHLSIWAQHIIANDQSGNPVSATGYLYAFNRDIVTGFKSVSKEWAQETIIHLKKQQRTIPRHVIECLYHKFKFSDEWYNSVNV